MKKTRLLTILLLIILTTSSVLAFNITTYNNNGSYTVNSGVTKLLVEVQGGGGAGGVGTSGGGSGGGGGGGYARSYINVTPGTTYNVTVGIGGDGTLTLSGQPSWFGNATTIYAAGGIVGSSGAGAGGGAGGTNNTGQVTYNGGAGGAGAGAGGISGGGGGSAGDQEAGSAGSGQNAGVGGGNRGGGGARGAAAATCASVNGNRTGGGGNGGGAQNGCTGGSGGNGSVTIYAISSSYADYIISTYDENNQSIITLLNVSITPAINGTGVMSYTSKLSTIFVPSALSDNPANLRLSANTYGVRYYLMSGSGNNSQTGNAYLSRGTSNTAFTIVDQATNFIIPGATVYIYRTINNTDTLVQSTYTDVTGTTTFEYVPYARYSFLLTKTGYNSKSFILDPITFSAYSIEMSRGSGTIDFNQDFQNVIMEYSPHYFWANQTNTLTILFENINNGFTNYSYNLSYPGGSNSGSGNNPSGATIITVFNITGGNIFSTANLTLSYSTTAGNKTFFYPITIIYGPNSGTFASNIDNTYGMGLLERAIIGTLIIVVVVGMAAITIGSIPGLLIGMFLMGLFIKIGLWEWWLAGISFLIGVAIIIRRTE